MARTGLYGFFNLSILSGAIMSFGLFEPKKSWWSYRTFNFEDQYTVLNENGFMIGLCYGWNRELQCRVSLKAYIQRRFTCKIEKVENTRALINFARTILILTDFTSNLNKNSPQKIREKTKCCHIEKIMCYRSW